MSEGSQTRDARKKLSFAEMKALFTTELSEEVALGLIHAIPDTIREFDKKISPLLDFLSPRVEFLMSTGDETTQNEPSGAVRKAACTVLARTFVRHFNPKRDWPEDRHCTERLLHFYAAHEQHCPNGTEREEVKKFLGNCLHIAIPYEHARQPLLPIDLVERAIFMTTCADLVDEKKLLRFLPFFYNKERPRQQLVHDNKALFPDLEFNWSKLPHVYPESMRSHLQSLTKPEFASLKNDCLQLIALCGATMRSKWCGELDVVLRLIAHLQWELMNTPFHS